MDLVAPVPLERKCIQVGAVCGTASSDSDGLNPLHNGGLELATVEEHVRMVERLLENDGSPIKLDNFDRIQQVSDGLEQIMYWAMEEAQLDEGAPSVLAQCDSARVLALAAASPRFGIALAALHALSFALQHAQMSSEFSVCAATLLSEELSDHIVVRFVHSTALLENAMRRFPAQPRLLAFAIDSGAELLRCAMNSAWVAENKREEVNGATDWSSLPFVQATLRAMATHSTSPEVQLSGTLLLASLASSGETCEKHSMGVGLLFNETLLAALMRAAAAQTSQSRMVAATVHALHAWSAAERNRGPLIQWPNNRRVQQSTRNTVSRPSPVLPFLLDALRCTRFVPNVFNEAVLCIWHLLPAAVQLDRAESSTQVNGDQNVQRDPSYDKERRTGSLLRCLRDLVASDTSAVVLSLSITLIIALIAEVKRVHAASPHEFSGVDKPVAASPQSIVEFITELSLPPMLCAVDNYFGDEDAGLRSVTRQAIQVITNITAEKYGK